MRNIQEPVTVPDNSRPGSEHRTTTSHPAFGQIRASRVSGRSNLYGSDFTHNQYITVSICRSQFDRDLSRDWVHAQDELIEVKMSEAQWATFVSSLNVGGGVQCTLNHLDGESVPELPDPISRADQFGVEMRRTMQSATDTLRKCAAEVASMGLPKGKTKAIIDSFDRAIMQIDRNVPFVASQFEEHVEEVIESAKTEIHGHMVSLVQRAGLEALAAGGGVLELKTGDKMLLENKTE